MKIDVPITSQTFLVKFRKTALWIVHFQEWDSFLSKEKVEVYESPRPHKCYLLRKIQNITRLYKIANIQLFVVFNNE